MTASTHHGFAGLEPYSAAMMVCDQLQCRLFEALINAIDHTTGWRIRKLPVRLKNPEI